MPSFTSFIASNGQLTSNWGTNPFVGGTWLGNQYYADVWISNPGIPSGATYSAVTFNGLGSPYAPGNDKVAEHSFTKGMADLTNTTQAANLTVGTGTPIVWDRRGTAEAQNTWLTSPNIAALWNVNVSATYLGVRLTPNAGDPSSETASLGFYGPDSGSANYPYFTATYNTPPTVVQSTPAAGATVNTGRPTFTGTVTDPDSGQTLTIAVLVWTASSGGSVVWNSNSGTTIANTTVSSPASSAAWSITVPSDTSIVGGTYWWEAWAADIGGFSLLTGRRQIVVQPVKFLDAALVGSAAVSGTLSRARFATAGLNASASVSASAVRTRFVHAGLDGAASVGLPGLAYNLPVSAALNCTATIEADLRVIRELAADLGASAAVDAELTKFLGLGETSLSGSASLTAVMERAIGVSANLLATATTDGLLVADRRLVAELVGTAALVAELKRTIALAADLSGTAALGAALARIVELSAALEAHAYLTVEEPYGVRSTSQPVSLTKVG